jgi:fructokinase
LDGQIGHAMTYRILALGEVLWDLLPAGKQLGGAPANFAYHSRSLGADARLVTRIGNDPLGHEVLGRFRLLGLPDDTIQIDPSAPTGTVDVEVTPDGQPRFTIRENVAWDYVEADKLALSYARDADAICFGSLAQRSEPSRAAIRTLVRAASAGALRVFDVNLRPPFIDRSVIVESLELANVVKLNDQELPELAAILHLPDDTRDAIAALAQRFALSVVGLTRGSAGSLVWADGNWSDHPGRPVTVSDTIGAGDSFTAALVVGRLAGREIDDINRHANEVAAYVCTQPGGTPRLPDTLKSP